MKNISRIVERLVENGAPIPNMNVYDDENLAKQFISKYKHLLQQKKAIQFQKPSKRDFDNDNDTWRR